MSNDEPSSAPDDPSSRSSAVNAEGPVVSGRRRSRRWAVLVLCTVLVLMVGGTSFAAGLVWWGTSQVQRTEVTGLAPRGAPPASSPDRPAVVSEEGREILNVLVVGSDSRDSLSDERREAVAGGTASVGGRSDTIMLAQLEVRGESAALLSFPRDLWVTRCDGSNGRINGATTISSEASSGASCLVQTVSEMSGIDIHHYVEVDFDGFIQVVDVLGGVDMYFEEALRDPAAGLDVAAGCQRLDAAQSLAFVRARSLDPQGDFGRVARQQRFIREVVEDVADVGLLANPRQLVGVIEAGARAVTTDSGLGIGDMRDIATGLAGIAGENLSGYTVPGDNMNVNGAAVLDPRLEEAEAIFAAFRDGSALRGLEDLQLAAAGADAEALIDPATVGPITVMNASGIAGAAGDLSEALTEAGWVIVGSDNDPEVLERTEVRHSPEDVQAGVWLAEALEADAVEDPDIEGIIIRIGGDLDIGSIEVLDPQAVQPSDDGDEGEFDGDDGDEPPPSTDREPLDEVELDGGEDGDEQTTQMSPPFASALHAIVAQLGDEIRYRGTEPTGDRC